MRKCVVFFNCVNFFCFDQAPLGDSLQSKQNVVLMSLLHIQ